MTQDEWLEKSARDQRWMVKWVAQPFLAVWFALCLVTVVTGVTKV